MKLKYLLAASAISLTATVAALPIAVSAQQITSGVEGTVSSTDGADIAGASVVITDTRTNASRTVVADSNGSFRTSGLVPGGPYTITATADGFEGQSVEGQFITVSGATAYTFELASAAGATADNVIVVSASRANVTQLAVGPGSAFSTETLEAFPSINRDIRDIIRLDPRVSLERNNEVDRISCLGGNDRSNTFTVDGITQADVFGLNGTPFAARNSLPLPFDVIRETSVEFAPFDVEYSDFTGCLVNVVTKSGQNEFHGSAFYTYYDDSMLADTIVNPDGEVRPLSSGSEKRWGATLGGPIIPDRLFFYAGYEEVDLGDANDDGPLGGGFANEREFATQADFDRFGQIARDVYNQEIGGYPRTLPESSVRYFGRLDAYITDDQRLEATYQKLKESNVEPDFSGSDNLTGLNSFEDEGTQSDYYSLRLYSTWSDKVSTELRVSRSEVSDVQGPFGFGEAQSDNPTVRLVVGNVGPTGETGIFSTGPGIFRSANALESTVNQAKFQMNIDGGDHQFKIGAEVNDLEIYNLFAINATGSLYFQNLDDFENGILTTGFEFFPNADDITSGNSYAADINATPTGDINEAAATFGRTIYSFYVQDDWQATDQLSITAGVRAQLYTGDAPRANPLFRERFGFTNSNSFGKIDPVFLPRLSATYNFDNDGFFSNSRVTGGVGQFTGGDPVVFFSNAFSNNGFSSALGTSVFCAGADRPTNALDGAGNFTGFPTCVSQAGSDAAARGAADVQSTDPDFKVPIVTRANLGFSTDFGAESGFFSDWRLNLDYIYSRFSDPINFVDLAQTPDIRTGINGFTADGRPILAAIDPAITGCNATLQNQGGTPPTYTNVTANCFNTGIDDFIQLTNGRSYDSHVASFLLSKNFQGGLLTDGGGVSLRFGYAFTDSENFRDVGSSTATSNFDRSPAFDRQNPVNSTSNFETRHNITAAVSFREEFIDDYQTKLGVFFRARAGRPYSLTFDGSGTFADRSSGSDNALLYVPTGVTDPNLSPLSTAGAVNELISYVEASGCDFVPGQTISRNTCKNPWSYDLDLRFSQEIPGIGSLTGLVKDRFEFFADMDNFLNFIDSSANRVIFRPNLVDVIDGNVDANGLYILEETNFDASDPYNFINPDDDQNISTSASVWKIQVGVRYEF